MTMTSEPGARRRARASRSATPRHGLRPLAGALVAALLGALVACTEPVRDEQIERARQRADAAAPQLTTALMTKLNAALAGGDVAAAVGVCSQVAQEVTQRLGESEGVIVRRTALKVRNPANAPADWERAWLESADAAVRTGQVPAPLYEVARSPGGDPELRHLRPILFPGGLCSRCHGLSDEIPADVQALLRERYPQDQATGFRAGDLRGAISVRVPLVEGDGRGRR